MAEHLATATDPRRRSARLRVATWNILGCRGFPRFSGGPVAFPEVHPGIIAGVAERLRTWGLDAVLIQEAPPEPAVRELARLSGMQAAFLPAQAAAGPDYPFGFPGAVLARGPLAEALDRAAAIRTGDDPRFHRHWGSATLHHGGMPLRLATTHLCSDWGGVVREVTRLAEIDCVLAAGGIDLLGGDFNALEGSAPIERLRAAGWRDAWHEGHGTGDPATADTRRSVSYRIDYLWIAPESPWRALSTQIGADLEATVGSTPILLSDHFPVIVELGCEGGG